MFKKIPEIRENRKAQSFALAESICKLFTICFANTTNTMSPAPGCGNSNPVGVTWDYTHPDLGSAFHSKRRARQFTRNVRPDISPIHALFLIYSMSFFSRTRFFLSLPPKAEGLGPRPGSGPRSRARARLGPSPGLRCLQTNRRL